MNFKIKSIGPIFFLLFSVSMYAQQQNKVYAEYIEAYKELAIYHKNKYKIPASIKLAQGLLETGGGKSRLATQANNHFGIKCHGWDGEFILADDDAKNECFRKYATADDSYEDHSAFLLRYSRYASLFRLEPTDYKGWAGGLQEAGYATNKSYANTLIKLIEDYQLYQYDDVDYVVADVRKEEKKPDEKPQEIREYDIYKTSGGLLYVEVKANDSFTAIASSLGFKVKNLVKYNDVPNLHYPLNKGDVVYLETKKKKAELPYYHHIVRPGESMHSISQRYGIQLSRLYKINKKDGYYIPEDGDVLKLR